MSDKPVFIENWRCLPGPILGALEGLAGVLRHVGSTGRLLSLEPDLCNLEESIGGPLDKVSDLHALKCTVAPHEIRLVEDLLWLTKAPCDVSELRAASVSLNAVLYEIEGFLADKLLLCFHCTKEPSPGLFREKGLRILDCQSHQEEFLARYADGFTKEEITYMTGAWHHYFQEYRQATYRDQMLWFCLTQGSLFKEDATGCFFEYVGGEAIFMPLRHHKSIAEKLRRLGTSVVVVFKAPFASMRGGSGCKQAILRLLQGAHQSVNPSVSPHEVDAYVCMPVPPQDILTVIPKSELSNTLPLYLG